MKYNRWILLPVLSGFFIMGAPAGIISTAMERINEDLANYPVLAGMLPFMAFVWFLLISIPTGVLCGRIGRKNTVMLSLLVTVAAMTFPFLAGAQRIWPYFAAFACLGIGNTMIQASLPALVSNVVPPDQITSRLSLGQFVKAICGTVTPVIALACSGWLGNWKVLFLVFGALAFSAATWLFCSNVPREEATGPKTSFLSCMRVLADPYILAMTIGVLFAVGADIGLAVAIPAYLKDIFKLSNDAAGTGPSVYFGAKMIAAFAGSIVFAYISAARCFPYLIGMAILAATGLFFAPNPTVFLVLVFFAAVGFANAFGMCMGLAIDRRPDKANEISALMVMAICGGGISTFVMGLVRTAWGAGSITFVLLACLLYLLGLGIFAARQSSRRRNVL